MVLSKSKIAIVFLMVSSVIGCKQSYKAIDPATGLPAVPPVSPPGAEAPDDNQDQISQERVLKINSHQSVQIVADEQQTLIGECDERLGDITIDGDFQSAPDFVACVGNEFSHDIQLNEINKENSLNLSQGEGDQQQQVGAVLDLFPLGEFCGDGIVNQSWEICDGEEGCDEKCQHSDALHPRGTRLFRVTYAANISEIFSPVRPFVFVGEQNRSVPVETWIAVEFNGLRFVDQDTNQFKNVPGLVVQRQVNRKLKVLLPSASDHDDLRHIEGTIEFFNSSARSFTEGRGGEALEGESDLHIGAIAGNDEVRVSRGEVFFFLNVTSGDDAFTVDWR